MRIAFALLLGLLGLLLLGDIATRLVFKGAIESDMAAPVVIGTLCLGGAAQLWLSRRSGGEQNPPIANEPKADGESKPTFRKPFAAYNAGNNLEAHVVCGLLNDAGVPAMVIEDLSQVGVWWGGTSAEIHKPQVDRRGEHRAGATGSGGIRLSKCGAAFGRAKGRSTDHSDLRGLRQGFRVSRRAKWNDSKLHALRGISRCRGNERRLGRDRQ